MKGSLLTSLILILSLSASAQKTYRLTSPDERLASRIEVGEEVTFTLADDRQQILSPSPVALQLADGRTLGSDARVVRSKYASHEGAIASPFYKRSKVADRYNQLTLSFKGGYELIFRMYDDGLAYRFAIRRKEPVTVAGERAEFRLAADFPVLAAYSNRPGPTFESQFFNSFENQYEKHAATQLDAGRLIFLPTLVELADGAKLCITESDLEDYPGMFLCSDPATPSLKGVFATVPKNVEQGGHNRLQMLVTEREPYIARTSGTRAFPWRAFIVTERDGQLTESDMVYRLASPSRVEDISWIVPGKVAWEWWNNWNLYGVDFRAGIDNRTYKYYIDFASQHGIEYVILDEGWAVNKQADLMQVVPEIDIAELVAYGRERNVGIILWAGYYALDRDMERVVEHYADMGVKGFKVDFLDRDDQQMLQFMYRTAETCARHRMLVDFHGVCKPTGLQRTYPNVINYEGVFGLEQMKWAPPATDMVTYDVTIPFIRMVAGPMDYTQGAMRNSIRGAYTPDWSSPMSQGTRCRQLAQYVVFESPLNMLCDSPSNYLREEECIGFIASVPTTWDDTRVLDGRVGEYIAVARRSGDEWFVGALTDWTPRDLTLEIPVGEGDYTVEIFRDGINADRAAQDYAREVVALPADRKLTASLQPGGGWAARIVRKK